MLRKTRMLRSLIHGGANDGDSKCAREELGGGLEAGGDTPHGRSRAAFPNYDFERTLW
jgi:hypothetical protein